MKTNQKIIPKNGKKREISVSFPKECYGDPAEVADRMIKFEVRQAHGCAACKDRGAYLGFDRYRCTHGRRPNKQGFCKAWALDETAKALTGAHSGSVRGEGDETRS